MFKLRQAVPADIAAIASIIAMNFDTAMPEHSPAVREICKKKSSEENLLEQLSWKLVFIIEDNHAQICATGGLADFGSPQEHFYSISNLFVRPDMHGQGLGDVLIRHLIYLAERNHAAKLHVPSSRTALKFYQKYGFEVDAEQPAEDLALEVTWMSRTLNTCRSF